MSKGKKRTTKVVPWTDLKTVGASPTKIPEHVPLEQLKAVKINRRRILIEWGIIALVAVLVYLPSYFSSFAFMDDYLTGPFASQAMQPHVWQDLLAQAFVAPLSQPWLKASFALDLNGFGREAFWYRFVNVILHIASCIYLYLLAFRISRRFQPVLAESDPLYDALPLKIAFYTGLLFAVHPLATESIAYISGRGGVLAGANCLLAINLFLFGFWSDRIVPIVFGYLGCLACLVMGFATSPEGTAIPLVLLASAFLLGRSKETRRFLDQRTVEMVFLAILAVLLPFAAKLPFWNDFGNNFGMPPLAPESYYASELKGFLFYYLRCAVLPFGLSVEPPYFVATSWDSPGTIIGTLSYFGLAVLVFLKRDKLFISYPLAITVLGYLPSLLIQRGEYGADRRFYIPLIGLCLFAGWNYARFSLRRPKMYLAPGIAVLVAFAGLTVWRQFDWSSTENIWKAAERVAPSEHAKAMNALFDVGVKKADDAKKAATDILKDDPNCQLALLTLALFERGQKHPEAAKPFLQKALSLASNQHLDRYDQYQTALLYSKNLIDLKQYEAALNAVMPIYFAYTYAAQPNLLIGQAMLGKNDSKSALRYLDAAYKTDKLNPDYIVPLAQACFATDIPVLVDNAYKSSKIFLRIAANKAVSLVYAQAALQVGRPDECLLETSKLLNYHKDGELSKEEIAKCNFLQAKAQEELGHADEAERLTKLALASDPEVKEKLKLGTIRANLVPAKPAARKK